MKLGTEALRSLHLDLKDKSTKLSKLYLTPHLILTSWSEILQQK